MIIEGFNFLDKKLKDKVQVYGFSGEGFSIFGSVCGSIVIIERRFSTVSEFVAIGAGPSESEIEDKTHSTTARDIVNTVKEFGSTETDMEIISSFIDQTLSVLSNIEKIRS